MEEKEPKNLNQISNKDLIKDFFEAITDIERRLIKTIKELTVCPEKVIFGYISGDQKDYVSVFRYLLFSIFISYVSYTFLMNPSEIGGEFYESLSNGIKEGLKLRADKFEFSQEAYDVFYTEYMRLMSLIYKLIVCFSIPAVWISIIIFFRKLRLNIASQLVASVFIASHFGLISSLLFGLFLTFIENQITASYFAYAPMFLYMCFAFTRIGKGKKKINFLRGVGASLVSIACILIINIGTGMLLTKYIQSYTPKFIKKIERTQPSAEVESKKKKE